MTNQEAGYQRFEHCTHPGQDWCDCDWCRFLRMPATGSSLEHHELIGIPDDHWQEDYHERGAD